jgi:hypothetical protein
MVTNRLQKKHQYIKNKLKVLNMVDFLTDLSQINKERYQFLGIKIKYQKLRD